MIAKLLTFLLSLPALLKAGGKILEMIKESYDKMKAAVIEARRNSLERKMQEAVKEAEATKDPSKINDLFNSSKK